MIEFLVDNIFVRFGEQLFRQTVGIPMGTNCATLLADLFLYSYENEFLINSLRRVKESLLESSVSHTVILMILSLSIIKDLRNSSLIFTPKNSPFLRLQNLLQLLLISTYFLLEMRTTTLPPNYMTNVMDAFDFYIVNFPVMSRNIPLAPACGIYASQLIRYARCCSNYSDFLSGHRALVTRLLLELQS